MHSSESDRTRPLTDQSVEGALVPFRERPPSTWTAPGTLVKPPALNAGPDALGLLKALRRRWALALIASLLASALVGGATWFLVPPSKYTARATLHASAHPHQVIFDTREQQTNFSIYQQTQIQLIKGDMVLLAALEKPGIENLLTIKEQADPVEWLNKELIVGFPANSEVLHIALSGSRPSDLSKLVNAVVDAYHDTVVNDEGIQRRKRFGELGDYYKRYQRDLQVKRDALKDKVGVLGSDDQETLAKMQQTNDQLLANARAMQMQCDYDLHKAKTELSIQEDALNQLRAAPPISDEEVEVLIAQHPGIRALEDQLKPLKSRIGNAGQKARNQRDPSITRPVHEVEQIEVELKALRSQLRMKAVADAHEERLREAKANVAKARQEVVKLAQSRDFAGQKVSQLSQMKKEQARDTSDLKSTKDEIATAEDAERKIAQELEVLKVELNAPARIKVLAKARVPIIKDESRSVKIGGTAAAIALISVLLGVSFWEFRSRRIETVDEVIDGLGMRLVGTLPNLPARADSGSSADQRKHQLLVESIDSARSLLLHMARTEGVRAVMITSAVKGEGKTTLSGHLATSLARAGRRTILLDCDLRNPSLHKLFDISVEPGLAEVLRGESDITEVIRPTVAEYLWIVSAGGADPQAIQGLARGTLGSIIDRLRDQFDFIIVDTTPVLPVSDALSVSDHVDGVIFAVMRHTSRGPKVYAAYERLAALGRRILGAVVAGGLKDVNDYGYYYGSKQSSQS